MLGWLEGAVSGIFSWLGSGLGSFFKWLLDGIVTIFTKVINAADGFWDVLDALWGFAIGFKDDLLILFTTFFPFVPVEVVTVISLGLIAVLVAGFVRRGRH